MGILAASLPSHPPAPPSEIARIAKMAEALSLAGIALIVVWFSYSWSQPDEIRAYAARIVGAHPVVIDPLAWIGSGVVMLLVLGSAVVALGFCYDFFHHLRHGFVFTAGNAARLRRLGLTVVFALVASILAQPALAVLFTHANPPGQRVFVLMLSSSDLVALLLALVLFAFGSILSEAVRLSEENQSFV